MNRIPGRLAHGVALVSIWAVLVAVLFPLLFVSSSRDVDLFGHEAVIRPTLDRHLVLHTGPVLPDVRADSGWLVGADIYLGRTEASSADELIQRYAVIAGQPEGQAHVMSAALVEMALSAGLRTAGLALLPIGGWLLLGSARRRELSAAVTTRRGGVTVLAGLLVAVAIWQPWQQAPQPDDSGHWQPMEEFLGLSLPEGAAGLEVRGDVTTRQSRRLILSAVGTYEKSKVFYDTAAEAAGELDLHRPEQDQTVAILVSDRHDNIGMDRVARAIADRAGATVVFNAGDDTSNGARWEAFSLDSVSAAFQGFDRFGVSGNHDHGSFVGDYLADSGWRMLNGDLVEGPDDSVLLGVPDPRSSGLGAWREETGLSFDDVAQRLATAACASEERVNTMLVHDANLGRPALERGCVDLVIGGHLHVAVGPVRFEGPDGEVGYSYTNGTTGGAAYAIALGKTRREATVTLITYANRQPVGIQSVVLQTNGVFVVGEYAELSYQ